MVKGRVRVHINGLKPLEKFLDISLEGETKQVELEYEKLDKHCFSCLSMSHEVKDPLKDYQPKYFRPELGNLPKTYVGTYRRKQKES